MVGSSVAWKQACIIYDTTVLKGCKSEQFWINIFCSLARLYIVILLNGMENMEKMLLVYYLFLYKALISIKSSVNMDDFTPKSRWFMYYTVYNIQYSLQHTIQQMVFIIKMSAWM